MYVCQNCVKMGKMIKEEPKNRNYSVIIENKEEDEIDLLSDIKEGFVDNFNTIIRKNRQQKNLTIKELAGKLNIKESIMKKIEHGEIAPDNTLKNKLEKYLKIKLTNNNL